MGTQVHLELPIAPPAHKRPSIPQEGTERGVVVIDLVGNDEDDSPVKTAVPLPAVYRM